MWKKIKRVWEEKYVEYIHNWKIKLEMVDGTAELAWKD